MLSPAVELVCHGPAQQWKNVGERRVEKIE